MWKHNERTRIHMKMTSVELELTILEDQSSLLQAALWYPYNLFDVGHFMEGSKLWYQSGNSGELKCSILTWEVEVCGTLGVAAIFLHSHWQSECIYQFSLKFVCWWMMVYAGYSWCHRLNVICMENLGTVAFFDRRLPPTIIISFLRYYFISHSGGWIEITWQPYMKN